MRMQFALPARVAEITRAGSANCMRILQIRYRHVKTTLTPNKKRDAPLCEEHPFSIHYILYNNQRVPPAHQTGSLYTYWPSP